MWGRVAFLRKGYCTPSWPTDVFMSDGAPQTSQHRIYLIRRFAVCLGPVVIHHVNRKCVFRVRVWMRKLLQGLLQRGPQDRYGAARVVARLRGRLHKRIGRQQSTMKWDGCVRVSPMTTNMGKRCGGVAAFLALDTRDRCVRYHFIVRARS